jgi:hypothetical protein
MSDKNHSVSGELLTQLEARAEVEGRTVDELAEEAVRRLKMVKFHNAHGGVHTLEDFRDFRPEWGRARLHHLPRLDSMSCRPTASSPPLLSPWRRRHRPPVQATQTARRCRQRDRF